jgi:hypothetical protein
MHGETATATIEVPRSTVLQELRYRDRFFLGMAVAAAVSVFLGFARTYYLKTIFPLRSFPLLFHIHGALFTAWMIVLVLQVSLVASRRIALHRRVGWIGLSLVVPMLVTGFLAAIAAARGQAPLGAAVRAGELTWVNPGIPPVEMLFGNLVAMLLFGVFAGAGLAWRRRPEAHKRFMALATIVLLPAAIGRAAITFLGVFHPVLLVGTTGLFVLAMVMHDRRSRRRVDPVTLWGGLTPHVVIPRQSGAGEDGSLAGCCGVVDTLRASSPQPSRAPTGRLGHRTATLTKG